MRKEIVVGFKRAAKPKAEVLQPPTEMGVHIYFWMVRLFKHFKSLTYGICAKVSYVRCMGVGKDLQVDPLLPAALIQPFCSPMMARMYD